MHKNSTAKISMSIQSHWRIGHKDNRVVGFYHFIVLVEIHINLGGIYGIMAIVVGNGHSNPSSNSGKSCLHFT